MDLYRRNNRPALRLSAVAYLDELGTSSKLAALEQADLEDMLGLYSSLDELLPDMSRLSDHGRFLSFSDNIVIGVPVDEADGSQNAEIVSALSFSLLLNSARYQLRLAITFGRILRGGFSVGHAYMDDRIVTGPAHLEAVILEERTAIYPRILVSQSALSNLGPGTASVQLDWLPDSAILVDADGWPFINYLAVVPLISDGKDEATYLHYQFHRDLIEQHLSDASGRIRDKYIWMAHYHNFIISETQHIDLLVKSGLSEFENKHPRLFARLSF